ncbi:FAD-dependent monooxygenase [Microbispora hainanensis]|uniref:FAD-dependent monooxygenase n=1 Tax=Microbispora hainanensis TaxID=568844 RepID=UPI0033C67BCC
MYQCQSFGTTRDRPRPLTREHLQTVLRRVSGTDATITEVHLTSSFTDRAMQDTTYRHGRVLLAGDAARIHSPLGGQGLNLGIGDAVDLGWKLAATVHGTAPDFRLADGTRLGDLLCEGHGVALDFTAGRCLHDAATSGKGRIRYAAGPVRDDLGFGALLIRPDGIVAWTGGRDPDPEAFRHAAARWFGDPAP